MLSQLKQTQLLTTQEKHQHIQLSVPMLAAQEKNKVKVPKHDKKQQNTKISTQVSGNIKSTLGVNKDIRHVANYVENHSTLQKQDSLRQTCTLQTSHQNSAYEQAIMHSTQTGRFGNTLKNSAMKQSLQQFTEQRALQKELHKDTLNCLKSSINFNVKQIIRSNIERSPDHLHKPVGLEKHLALNKMAMSSQPYNILQNFIHQLDTTKSPQENLEQLSHLIQQDNLKELEEYIDTEKVRTLFKTADMNKIYSMLRRKITRDTLAKQQRQAAHDLTKTKNTCTSQLQHSQGIAVFPVFQDQVDQLAHQKSYKKICKPVLKQDQQGNTVLPCRHHHDSTLRLKRGEDERVARLRILEDYGTTESKEGKHKEFVAQQNYSALFLGQVQKQLE